MCQTDLLLRSFLGLEELCELNLYFCAEFNPQVHTSASIPNRFSTAMLLSNCKMLGQHQRNK